MLRDPRFGLIPLLAIVGPTASGKTEWGLRLAQEQDAEIISVDSRQVYRFLSVGTAKPSGQWVGERETKHYRVQGVPYHLVDIWNPNEPFSAASFVQIASARIKEIRQRGKKPILVGGTGLYFKALVEGLAPLPPRDEGLRSELRALADKKGRPYLHNELARVDPVAAARIPANNIARVTRALEVFKLTGKPISQWHQEHREKAPPPLAAAGGAADDGRLRLRCFGIALSKEELNRRIEERSTRMLEGGMIEETQHLLNRNDDKKCPALSGLGYPRVIAYLQGKISPDELRALLIRDTRQYAKRQMTWFRHQMNVEWSWKKQ